MNRFHIEQAFIVLKPLCDDLMKHPSVENASEVTRCVQNIDDAVIQQLLEYILHPIITHLHNEKVRMNVKEHLIIAMRAIILKVRISKLTLFNRLYTCLLVQIYDKNQPSMLLQGHEELKEIVALCITDLIHRSFTDVIESLYVRSNAPKIGQAVYLFVAMIKNERCQSLRLSAINSVMALCQVDEQSDMTDIILQNQIANIIMLFLPGIASGLLEAAIRTDIQNHKITMMAIRAWARIISLVMKDSDESNISSIDTIMNEKTNMPDPLGTKLHEKGSNGMKTLLETATRNREWIDAASIKLNILIQELGVLKSHSDYKVRKELTKGIELLLTTCCRNMKSNAADMIDHLISLSEDDFDEVRSAARTALEAVNLTFMTNVDNRPFVMSLEERFYGILTELPRVIRRSGNDEQLSCLNQFAGYLRLLGKPRLPQFLMPIAHTRRLLFALVYVLEMDSRNVSLLQDVGIRDLDEATDINKSHEWKRFKFIDSKPNQHKIIEICTLLGKFGDLRILVDALLNLMSEIPRHRKELILLLNWITNVPITDSSVTHLYKEIIDYYTDNEIWYSPITVTESTPLCTAQSNIIQWCLLTEGLGLIALNLNRDYDRFLLKTLYLVIERAGSGHGLISSVGTRCLENIAKSQDHESIGDLLRVNIDYFSYHVTMKLRRVERNPGVLDVVGVVMKYSTIDVMPCLTEIINDILSQLSTVFQKQNVRSFLKSFYIFVVCLRRIAGHTGAETKHDTVKKRNAEHETVIHSLLEYYEAKQIDETIEDTIEQEEKHENDEIQNYMDPEEEEKAMTLPSYATMLKEVMKGCLHFVPVKEVENSLLAMLTIQEGVKILVTWENELLPIVHDLWHPLVDRFHDENVLVINRAWQLLCTLAQVSKDFIRSRTLKQVLPALSKFLSKTTKDSCVKDSSSVYQFTQTYKLQKELLLSLGKIVQDLKLHEREVWNVLTIAEPYLNSLQNPTLQKYCVSLYTDIADYNEDIAWVKCLSIWNSKVASILSDETFNGNLEVTEVPTENEYYTNVQTIMMYINQKRVNV